MIPRESLRPGLRERLAARVRAEHAAYAVKADDERPLPGYATAMGVFTVLTLTVHALSKHRAAERPLTTRELLLLGAATHKLARVISKDAVASPLRAPFTRYSGPGGPGEVTEEVRGEGLKHSAGELLTCPFCMAPWIATTLLGGRAVAPELTRHVTHVFSVVTVADFLQFVYASLEQSATQE